MTIGCALWHIAPDVFRAPDIQSSGQHEEWMKLGSLKREARKSS